MARTYYFWDPLSDNILQERDETGAVTAEYTTEPGLYGNVISQNRQGTERQYHFDVLGSTLALTDDDQQVTDTWSYTAWGEVTERTGSTEIPFQYVGQKGFYWSIEQESVIVGKTLYSPETGRLLAAAENAVWHSYVFSAIRSDEDYCEQQLEKIWTIWKFTHPCAAALLRGFLFGRPDRCPETCRKTLRERGLDFVESCIERTVGGDRLRFALGAGLGTCGKTLRHKFELFGCHDFQGPPLKLRFDPYPGKSAIGLEGDLGLGFGCVQWNAQVSCLTTCGPPDPLCCCDCTTRCGYDFTLTDTYDFCSTVPPGTPKYHPLWCACLLEKKGRGKVYGVKCTMTVYGPRPGILTHQSCGTGPRALNPICPHTHSAPFGVPIRKTTCKECAQWY